MSNRWNPHVNVMEDPDRFWNRVDRTGDCWIWTGALDPHGYGRLVIGQKYFRAHYVAWFMVMGTWPSKPLYRTCNQWGTKGLARWMGGDAPKEWQTSRTCVKPQHYREGPTTDAAKRWLGKAQNGFPPEFRNGQAQFMSSRVANEELEPLLLYRGNLSHGRALALFNWTLVAQAEEAARLGDVATLSQSWPDAAHAVGLHKPITVSRTVTQFWGRVLHNPSTTSLRPGMREYIGRTLDASGVEPIKLERISHTSKWSMREWRRPARLPRAPKPKRLLTPMPEVWPFQDEKSDPAHDLVLSVDNIFPKTLPEDIRQDICQDALLAVLEGELTVEQLRDHRAEFVAGCFRKFGAKYGQLSLDSSIHGTDNLTIGDTLAAAPIILDGGAGSWEELRERVASAA